MKTTLLRNILFAVAFVVASRIAAHAQAPTLAWNEDPSSTVTGYSLTIDGVRTDYHLTPVSANGTCNCSVPLPFSGGRHTVVVGAYNTIGETRSASLVIAPSANAGGPYSGSAGTALAVNASGSNAPTGTITGYAWSWGDGATSAGSSPQASHTYAAAGTYTITLTITDNAGATASATTTATITGKAPSTPSNPTPASGLTGVSTFPVLPTLTWSSSGAASYTVNFGTTNPPPLAAASLTSASYAPSSLAAARTYFWQVIGHNGAGTTTGPIWSFTTAAASPSGPLPSPWLDRDIGAVGIAGNATYSSGVYAVTGSGADIWNAADAFHFVYQPLAGNGQIVARVATVQNVNPWTKAEVMIRNSLATDSAFASMLVSSAKGVEFQSRAANGASATAGTAVTNAAPYWIKLVRTGNSVAGFRSADGVTWTAAGTVTLPSSSSVFVGLAVTSHDNTTKGTATFDQVTVAASGSLPAPWQHTDVGSVGVAGKASVATTVFSVTGSGADIWNAADAFQFVYQSLAGNGQIVARITAVQNVNPWTKAEVMIRNSLAANAAFASMVVSSANGVQFQSRATAGANATAGADVANAAPYWIKLVRSGATVSGFRSADGATWTAAGTVTLPSSASVFIGLAVTSHDNTKIATVTFDNVMVTPGT